MKHFHSSFAPVLGHSTMLFPKTLLKPGISTRRRGWGTSLKMADTARNLLAFLLHVLQWISIEIFFSSKTIVVIKTVCCRQNPKTGDHGSTAKKLKFTYRGQNRTSQFQLQLTLSANFPEFEASEPEQQNYADHMLVLFTGRRNVRQLPFSNLSSNSFYEIQALKLVGFEVRPLNTFAFPLSFNFDQVPHSCQLLILDSN